MKAKLLISGVWAVGALLLLGAFSVAPRPIPLPMLLGLAIMFVGLNVVCYWLAWLFR